MKARFNLAFASCGAPSQAERRASVGGRSTPKAGEHGGCDHQLDAPRERGGKSGCALLLRRLVKSASVTQINYFRHFQTEAFTHTNLLARDLAYLVRCSGLDRSPSVTIVLSHAGNIIRSQRYHGGETKYGGPKWHQPHI